MKNNIFFTSDPNKIVYPAGHFIVIHNVEAKKQSFLQGIDGSTKISCIAMSPQKR
jgi:hypothetical protein